MTKQYILEEIKRTAMTNGGIVLGKDRFFKETGIKFSDWYGKFWVRWTDAVKEAGFTPNKMVSAYDEELLIEKYIELIRDLKHFPVVGEVRIKAHTDKSFPSHTVFDRFGSKWQLASKVAEYCRLHKGFEDVLILCEPILENQEKLSKEVYQGAVEIGFVYLIKSGRYYKVGRSNAVGRREYELAIQLPEKGETIHTIRTDDPVGIEAYWHKRFYLKRKNGEWFELASADVMAFKRRKFM